MNVKDEESHNALLNDVSKPKTLFHFIDKPFFIENDFNYDGLMTYSDSLACHFIGYPTIKKMFCLQLIYCFIGLSTAGAHQQGGSNSVLFIIDVTAMCLLFLFMSSFYIAEGYYIGWLESVDLVGSNRIQRDNLIEYHLALTFLSLLGTFIFAFFLDNQGVSPMWFVYFVSVLLLELIVICISQDTQLIIIFYRELEEKYKIRLKTPPTDLKIDVFVFSFFAYKLFLRAFLHFEKQKKWRYYEHEHKGLNKTHNILFSNRYCNEPL